MKDIQVLDKGGNRSGSRKVAEGFSEPSRINTHTFFEAVNAENQNRRQGTHDTKNKSEVSGTGKKPYKQKHTGRARQGSRRNPHYRGGGIAFGPTPEKNYRIRVNKKVSRIAFVTAFYRIVESEQVAVLDESISSIKYRTREFAQFLKDAKLEDRKILLIADMDEGEFSSSVRNIANVRLRSPRNCSVRDLLNQNYMLITGRALEEMYRRMG